MNCSIKMCSLIDRDGLKY